MNVKQYIKEEANKLLKEEYVSEDNGKRMAFARNTGSLPTSTTKTFKVTFDGFETMKQAEIFAAWYESFGEQQSGDWMSHHGDVTGAYVDLDADNNFKKTADSVIVKLKIYK